MRRTLVVLGLVVSLLAVACPAAAGTPTRRHEERQPGRITVRLTHGRETAFAFIGLNGLACPKGKGAGRRELWAEVFVHSPGHRVSADAVVLVRGASVVRQFTRQQIATSQVTSRTHWVAPTSAAIYRVKATFAVRWRDRSLTRLTVWTPYSASIPACAA